MAASGTTAGPAAPAGPAGPAAPAGPATRPRPASPAGIQAAPAALVRDFVNTLDVESGEEQLQSPRELARWLRDRGLPAGRSVTDADLSAALALREGLRAELRAHHDNAGAPARGHLDQVMAAYPLRVSVRTGTPELEPVGSGTSAGLARIVAAVAESHADRTWQRLKVCAESTCQWAFVDTSKNQSRSWCSMRVCGNRAKTKAYRARHGQA
jgi:predicted RNA-binding Zn ribbon-like protein